jgi:HrpA-like RNA helicase
LSANSKFDELRQFLGLRSINHYKFPGLTFPIKNTFTLTPVRNHIGWAVSEVKRFCGIGSGGIMVFVSGSQEAETIAKELRASTEINRDIVVFTLYSDMSPSRKAAATAPLKSRHRRRVLVSTSIAETSITIPDVTTVIDTYLQWSATYDPIRDHRRIVLGPVNHAQGEERAGRVGRTRGGAVSRAITEAEYDENRVHRQFSSARILSEKYTDGLLSNLFIAEVYGRYGISRERSENPRFQGCYALQREWYSEDWVEAEPPTDEPSAAIKSRAAEDLRMLGLVKWEGAGRIALTQNGRSVSKLSCEAEVSTNGSLSSATLKSGLVWEVFVSECSV